MDVPWTIEKPAPNITVIRMIVDSPDWRQDFMVRSDVHRDSVDCRTDLEDYQIAELERRNAGLIDAGDLYDAMQGPGDKRGCKEAIGDGVKASNYFDLMVRQGHARYEGVAHRICSLFVGNHEEAVLKHYGTDLTDRTADRLRMTTGAPVYTNGYQGWVVFVATRGSSHRRLVMFVTHGYGGGGQVTKDLIQLHRLQSYTNADIIAFGHTHDLWITHDTCLHINNSNREVERPVCGMKCGTLKQKYGKKKKGDEDHSTGRGWEQTKGHRPKVLGHNWLTLRWHRDGNDERLVYDAVSERLV